MVFILCLNVLVAMITWCWRSSQCTSRLMSKKASHVLAWSILRDCNTVIAIETKAFWGLWTKSSVHWCIRVEVRRYTSHLSKYKRELILKTSQGSEHSNWFNISYLSQILRVLDIILVPSSWLAWEHLHIFTTLVRVWAICSNIGFKVYLTPYNSY